MAQSFAEFGDVDIQQSGGQEEAEFGALELQQAQVLFSALNTLRQGQPPLVWDSEAAAEIEVSAFKLCVWSLAFQVVNGYCIAPGLTVSASAGYKRKNFSSCYGDR